MGQEQFAAIMPFICADLVGMIAQKEEIPESQAISKLYNSDLYAMLEQEETKLWHYSTDMLYSLFSQEERTGKIDHTTGYQYINHDIDKYLKTQNCAYMA